MAHVHIYLLCKHRDSTHAPWWIWAILHYEHTPITDVPMRYLSLHSVTSQLAPVVHFMSSQIHFAKLALHCYMATMHSWPVDPYTECIAYVCSYQLYNFKTLYTLSWLSVLIPLFNPSYSLGCHSPLVHLWDTLPTVGLMTHIQRHMTHFALCFDSITSMVIQIHIEPLQTCSTSCKIDGNWWCYLRLVAILDLIQHVLYTTIDYNVIGSIWEENRIEWFTLVSVA